MGREVLDLFREGGGLEEAALVRGFGQGVRLHSCTLPPSPWPSLELRISSFCGAARCAANDAAWGAAHDSVSLYGQFWWPGSFPEVELVEVTGTGISTEPPSHRIWSSSPDSDGSLLAFAGTGRYPSQVVGGEQFPSNVRHSHAEGEAQLVLPRGGCEAASEAAPHPSLRRSLFLLTATWFNSPLIQQ